MALRGTLTHRKTRRLAQVLRIEVPAALGYVEALLHVTGEQAISGDIGRMSNEDIAMEIFSSLPPDDLVEAFVASGWIDKHPIHRLVVHDWSQHSDDAVDVKLARKGMTYADGSTPRMTKLSGDERAKICQKFGWPLDEKANKVTKSHSVAQNGTSRALPEPGPEPDTGKKNISDLPPAPAGDKHAENGMPRPAQTVVVTPAVSVPQQPGKLFEMQIRQPVAQVTVMQGSMTANGLVPSPSSPIPESPPTPPSPKKSKAQQEREEFIEWLESRYDEDLYLKFWRRINREDGLRAIRKQVREKNLRTREDWYALLEAFEQARPEQEARAKKFKKTIGPWINSKPWTDLPDDPEPPLSDEPDRVEVPELL